MTQPLDGVTVCPSLLFSFSYEMGKINIFLLHFTSYYLLKMSRRKSRTWHFRDPKFQNFLGGGGGGCPQTPLVVSASGASKMPSRAYIFQIPRYAPGSVSKYFAISPGSGHLGHSPWTSGFLPNVTNQYSPPKEKESKTKQQQQQQNSKTSILSRFFFDSTFTDTASFINRY